MRITIITLFPDMFRGFLEHSIVKRAQNAGKVSVEIVQLRDFAVDDYGTVDDRPYGGGAGMVLMAEPAVSAIISTGVHIKNGTLEHQDAGFDTFKVIATSPRGKKYDQKKAIEFSKLDHLVILAGHYEAHDERISQYIDEEISVGDYVLTGGELPAAMIVDSVVRLLPGVLKKADATTIESFFSVSISDLLALPSDLLQDEDRVFLENLQNEAKKRVSLLEYPQYTRPQVFNNQEVPAVLLSGDPKKIIQWQLSKAFYLTKSSRPDLFELS